MEAIPYDKETNLRGGCPLRIKTRHAQAFKRYPLLLQYQTLVGMLAIDVS